MSRTPTLATMSARSSLPARLLLAVGGAALVAAVAARSGAAVPPHAAALAFTTGLLAVVLSAPTPPRRRTVLLVAALAGAAAAHRLLAPGVPFGHDTIAHLWTTFGLCRAATGGELLPRWLHELGLGLPLFHFYPPGAFVLTLPWCASGASPTTALAASFALCGVASACAMAWAAQRWWGDPRAALVAGVAYAFAPYRLLDTGYRGAFAESVAMALLPLAWEALRVALVRSGARRVALAGLAAAGLVVVHPVTAIVVAAVALPAFATEAVARRRGVGEVARGAARLTAATALALALAAFYLVPFAVELPRVQAGASGRPPSPYAALAASPGQLVDRVAWSALRLSSPHEAESGGDEMPLYVGVALLGLALVGAFHAVLRGAGDDSRAREQWALALSLGVALVLGLAHAIRPLAVLGERLVPAIAMLYYPWRFLAVASFAAAALAGAAFVATASSRQLGVGREGKWRLAPLGAALAATVLVADGSGSTGAAAWLPPSHDEVASVAGPRTARGEPRGVWRATPLAAPVPPRVAGLHVPPRDRGVDVGHFFWAYPEFFTPRAHAAFLREGDLRSFARAGVGALAWPDGRTERLAHAALARRLPPRGTEGGAQTLAATRMAGRLLVALDGVAGRVVILEQAYPGWRARVDGGGWSEPRSRGDGTLEVDVGAGTHQLELVFSRPFLYRVASGWVSVAAVLVAGVLLARRPRRR